MRGIFPVMENGYFLVHLMPERDVVSQSEGTAYDTLLLGIPDETKPSNLITFAKIAAEANFNRITGMTDEKYSSDDEVFKFQTIENRSDKHKERVSEKKKQLTEEYSDIISDYLNNSNHDFEKLMELMQSGVDACRNIDKLREPCSIRVSYFEETDDYELLLYPPRDEPFVCDFGRGTQVKALYILFLRHLKGITLKDLEFEDFLGELARIYHKLKICDLDKAYKKAKAVAAKSRFYQAIGNIEKLFNNIFVESVADKYCIEKRGGKYRIALDKSLVILDNPFNQTEIGE